MNCNILMALSQFDGDEVGIYVFELAKELTKRGSKVVITSCGGALVNELSKHGIKHYILPLNSKSISNVSKCLKEFEKIIFSENISMVHSYGKIPLHILGKLKKKLGFPFVTTVHKSDKKRIFASSLNLGDKTLCIGNDIYNRLIAQKKANAENVILTVNGIDIDKFSKKKSDVTDNTVVCIDDIPSDSNSISYMLTKSVKRLHNIIDDLKLVIIADNQEFENLENKIKEANKELGKEIIFVTKQKDDLEKTLSDAKLFVGASTNALEAMACEVPTLIAENDGYLGLFCKENCEQCVDNDFSCKGLEKANIETLSQEIGEFFGKWDDEREELGKYSRKIVAENYSVKRMTDDVQKVYEELIVKK